MKPDSKTTAILRVLGSGETLTTFEAFKRIKTTCLSQRINLDIEPFLHLAITTWRNRFYSLRDNPFRY